ncbi:hypothetical protein [Legionella quinlivanii]|uniref:hypothetical protein n=1 Tax=Legionella quinlivanii TaxID=45073 RepID=UPI002243ED5E|nr:hypothetical protein [Legionella quinlivanii]MCW8450689.1 hypothetical protein [Legionella quinlivanii]
MSNDIRLFLDNSLETLANVIAEFDSMGPLQNMHEKSIQAYTIRCAKLLRELIDSQNPSEALEQALRNNWMLIRNSLLSYTALPLHPLTAIWCEAAKLIASARSRAEEPVNPLLLLIPELQCVISQHEDYPDLIPVFNRTTGQWEMDLLKILSTHILNDAGTHLIPLSTLLKLDETVGLPVIYNPYFDDNTDPASVELKEKETSRLYHYSFDTQIIYEAKQRFDVLAENNEGLLGQLRLLRKKMKENSRQGGQGTELEAGAYFDNSMLDFISWYNEIEDHSEEPNEVRLFIQTLRDFSGPLVRPFKRSLIVKTLQIIEQLSPDDKHVFQDYFAPLKTIVAMNNPGPEQLEEARKIIYQLLVQLGIIATSTHNNPLPHAIPEPLAHKLGKLKRYAFKKNNQEDPNTCLSILGTKLDNLLIRHSEALSRIKTSDNRQQVLMEKALKDFRSVKESFKEKLDKGEPLHGHDKLMLNSSVLNELNLRLSFEHSQDLEILETLSADEITSLCTDDRLVSSLLHRRNSDQLILFALTASTDKLYALLDGLSQSLLNGAQKNPEQLIPLLLHLSDAFEIDQCKLIYERIKDYLLRLCTDKPSIFSGDLLVPLRQPKKQLLLDTIINELPNSIKTAASFCKVYSLLHTNSIEKNELFFNQMRPRLPGLMRTINSSTQVFNRLRNEHRDLIFPNGLMNQSDKVKTLNQFIALFNSLNLQEREHLFATYKPMLLTWIKSSTHLLQLFKILISYQFDELLSEIQIDKLEKKGSSREIRSTLSSKYPNQIPQKYLSLIVPLTNITNVYSFQCLWDAIGPLNQEQQQVMQKVRGVDVSRPLPETNAEYELLLSESDLHFLNTTRGHITYLFERIEFRIGGLLYNSTYVISQVLKGLSAAQRDIVFDKYIQPKLAILIRKAPDWTNLLFYLNPIQRRIINQFVFDNLQLSQLFTKQGDFIDGPFRFLEFEQSQFIFSSLKHSLQKYINSFGAFTQLLSNLDRPKEENRELFDLFKNNLSRWKGKDADTISQLFSCLEDAQIQEAFDLLKRFIPEHMNSARDLILIGRSLNNSQFEQIRSKIKFKAHQYSITETLHELRQMTPSERAVTVDTIFDFLPDQINSLKDFSELSKLLGSTQCGALFVSCFNKLSPFLSGVNEYLQFIQSLDCIQGFLIYHEVCKKHPELISEAVSHTLIDAFAEASQSGISLSALIEVGKYLPPVPYQLLISKTHDLIIPRLTSIGDYLNFLESLTFEQACLIYPVIAKKVPEQSRTIFCLMLETFNDAPDKFSDFCNNPHFPLSNWLHTIDDFIYFMQRSLFLNIDLFLEAAKPFLQTLSLSASEKNRLSHCLLPAEYQKTVQCFPTLSEDKEQIDSPGRNPQAFFGLKRKNADARNKDCKRQHRAEPELEKPQSTYSLEKTDALSNSFESFSAMDGTIDDWLKEELESEDMEFETGFLR